MRLSITTRRVTIQGSERTDLEERLRLLMGSWTCRIRQARVYIEDVNGPKGGLDKRCVITALLIPSGKVVVQARGIDIENVVRGAARRLLRRVKREFGRKAINPSSAGRDIRSGTHVDLFDTCDEGC